MSKEIPAIFNAIEFAAIAHRGQCRKGSKIPYLIHPIGTVEILTRMGCHESLIIAGALHDVVEDTDTSLESISEHFGNQVSDLVCAVTEPSKEDTWESRKKHAIGHLKTATEDVVILKFADFLDNLRAMQEDAQHIGDCLWNKFKRPKDLQKWYAQELEKIFRERLDNSAGSVMKSYLEECSRGVESLFCK